MNETLYVIRVDDSVAAAERVLNRKASLLEALKKDRTDWCTKEEPGNWRDDNSYFKSPAYYQDALNDAQAAYDAMLNGTIRRYHLHSGGRGNGATGGLYRKSQVNRILGRYGAGQAKALPVAILTPEVTDGQA